MCCVLLLQVTSYSLSLREIDTVQDEEENGASGLDGGYVPNALEAVLRKRHLDLLQACVGGRGGGAVGLFGSGAGAFFWIKV